MYDVNAKWREDIQLFELMERLVTPEVTIEPNFKSDGVTGCWFTQWYVKPVNKAWFAAWVHDKCLKDAIKTKKWADLLFYKNLRRGGVDKEKARIMFFAVHHFGKGIYR